MKKLLPLLSVSLLIAVGGCGGAAPAPAGQAKRPAPGSEISETTGVSLAALTDEKVQIGCGMCQFHMDDVNSCTTAVAVGGKHILLQGDHADAHELGLCGTTREAVVSGKQVGEHMVLTKLEVIETSG